MCKRFPSNQTKPAKLRKRTEHFLYQIDYIGDEEDYRFLSYVGCSYKPGYVREDLGKYYFSSSEVMHELYGSLGLENFRFTPISVFETEQEVLKAEGFSLFEIEEQTNPEELPWLWANRNFKMTEYAKEQSQAYKDFIAGGGVPEEWEQEYSRIYYENNKELFLERSRRRREKNRESIIEWQRQHYRRNKEKIAKRQQEYVQDNKEKIAKYQSDYAQDNKEKIAKYQREYRNNNRETRNQRRREYRERARVIKTMNPSLTQKEAEKLARAQLKSEKGSS